MLPNNQIVQRNDVKMRRINVLIFLSISAMIMYSVTFIADSDVHNNSINKCLNEQDNKQIINYFQNSSNNPSAECLLYKIFVVFSERYFTGLLNKTYTNFLVYKNDQLEPNFNISVHFSQSPFDNAQQKFQFDLNFTEYVKTFNTPLILQLKNNDLNGCQNELTMDIKNTNNNNMNINLAEQFVIDLRVDTYCLNVHQSFFGQVKDQTEMIITYSFMKKIVFVCCMIHILRILNALIAGLDNLEEYNMISIGLVMVQDLFMFHLNHFQEEQSKYLFYNFIIPSFLQNILVQIFEIRIRNNQSFRNQVIKFYSILYFCMIANLYLIYHNILSKWLPVILSMNLLPLIIHSAQQEQFLRFNFKFILGFFIPRLHYYVYFRIFWNNTFSLNLRWLICIINSSSIQIVVYNLQQKLEHKFFVPKVCFPKKYNYFQKIKTTFDQKECSSSEYAHLLNEECSICLEDLDSVPTIKLTQEDERNLKIKEVMNKQQNYYMKTPCDHKFHVFCLVKWMQIQLSCPSCRQQLQPL
ncbi:unnamed protein product [Paramecium sonneborni]|uniref:RING-type E3 ubiquitin transferase n=1 Tax=Paramecium sonneborni TaxID=65129 RepID=A0A8S1LAL0_9CILI|nr:unnamed protein product [Paramecium sonneborni]